MTAAERVVNRLDRFERCHPNRPLSLVRTIDELATLRDKVALQVGTEAAERVVNDLVDKLERPEETPLH
jgi:hypothetical protein